MGEKIKILCLDDEPINLMLFRKIFEKKFDVKTAGSGFKGLEVLKEYPDTQAVISDMNMPGMNGIEFVTKAKALYPHICFYILSGYEPTSEIYESMEHGLILKYFKKPFRMAEIEIAIEENLLNK
jgi:two-component system response regulator (stage 0 sporulation protein F)